MDASEIIQHLVDFSKGICSITEETIIQLENEEDQAIMMGLLTLFEGIEYNKKKLEDSNKEKENLLKEIHHRVKNNLQIISSLLVLQGYAVDDEKTHLLLRDCDSRVRTMSIVHEKLYKSKDFGNVDYKDYLEELLRHLTSTHASAPDNVDVRLEIAPFKLCLDSAIPLGLVINEIVTNSMKYGFNQDEKTEIYMDVKEVEPGSFEMLIGDTGPGYSDDIFHSEGKTLGIQLIRDLVSQLDGSIEKLSDPERKGTHYQIRFEEIEG